MIQSIAQYIHWVMDLKNYLYILGVQTGSDPVSSLLGLPVIFSLGYVIAWIGVGVLMTTICQRLIDMLWRLRTTVFNKRKKPCH